jgi:NADPH-dependent curcumin reductase CurA
MTDRRNRTNRKWVLRQRPVGAPKPADIEFVEEDIPAPGHGQLLVQTLWLSLDPYMRLRAAGHARYYPAVPLGDVMIGGAVSRVLESRHPGFQPGDIIEDFTGWQEFAVADGATARKVDPSLGPIQTALGALGMPGLTAYLGLVDVGRPEPGDTVVLAAASGPVGSVVGQVAKIAGCNVVGIVGTPEKARYITEELKFDAAIDRRSEDIAGALDRLCADGINVYFENVGGPISEAVYPRLAHRARVVICGGITEYNYTETPKVASHLQNILFTEARVGGFNIFSYASRFEDARRRLAQWYRQGQLKGREDIIAGIENAGAAYPRLFDGANFGKLLVEVSKA